MASVVSELSSIAADGSFEQDQTIRRTSPKAQKILHLLLISNSVWLSTKVDNIRDLSCRFLPHGAAYGVRLIFSILLFIDTILLTIRADYPAVLQFIHLPPIGQNSQQMSQEYISDSSNSKSISFLLPLVLLQGIYIDEVSQRSQRKRSRKCPASTISLEAYNYAIDGKDKRQYCHRRKKDFKSICFHLWSSGNIIVSQ